MWNITKFKAPKMNGHLTNGCSCLHPCLYTVCSSYGCHSEKYSDGVNILPYLPPATSFLEIFIGHTTTSK